MANAVRWTLLVALVLCGLLFPPPVWTQRDVCHKTLEGRFDCGSSGSSEAACLQAGCCWSPDPNHIWCYYLLSSIRAKDPTDCSGTELTYTVDIAFVFDLAGSRSNTGAYLKSLDSLMVLLMDHTAYSPDLLRPAVASFSASYTADLPFKNNPVFHERQARAALSALRSKSSSLTSNLGVGLQAILALFTDPNGFPRQGAPRVAVLYITSVNTISQPLVGAFRNILKAKGIDVIFVDYAGDQQQAAKLKAIFPESKYVTGSAPRFHAVICEQLKEGKLRRDSHKPSLKITTLEFGEVFYRMKEDTNGTLVRLGTVPETGFIRGLKLEATTTGLLEILILRSTGAKMSIVGQIKLQIEVIGIQRLSVKPISVEKGDYIALYSKDTNLPIPYDSCGNKLNARVLKQQTDVRIGMTFDFTNARKVCREYSLHIDIATEFPSWTTYGSRSLKQTTSVTVLELSSIFSMDDCRDLCINHQSFECKAVEYANDGSNICRLLSSKFMAGKVTWQDAVIKFDYAEWTAIAAGSMAPAISGNVGSYMVVFNTAKPLLVFSDNIIIFRDLKFAFDTRVSGWKVRAAGAGTVYVCVWRWSNEYATYTLIGKDKVVFQTLGLKQVMSGIKVRRGDVIGLASASGGVGQVVEIGPTANANEASVIYTAQGDISMLEAGGTVSGTLTIIRGLPTLQAISAEDSATTTRRTAGAALLLITYNASSSVIKDSVSGGPGASIKVQTVKVGTTLTKYIQVRLASRNALTVAGDAGTLFFQFMASSSNGNFIDTIMEIFIGATSATPLGRMSVTFASSRYSFSLYYQDSLNVYWYASDSSTQRPTWMSFGVLTGTNGKAGTVYINGKKLTPGSRSLPAISFTIVNTMASKGELVGGLKSFKSALNSQDFQAMQELESPFPMTRMLPRISVTTSSSGIDTYSATVNLVLGQRVAYKVVWRERTSGTVLYEELVVIRPRKGQLVHSFELPSTASSTNLRTLGLSIEVQTCAPADCDTSVSGAQVSDPVSRDVTVLNSEGVALSPFPSMLTIKEGSYMTFTVRLNAPAPLFCDSGTRPCVVRLHTTASPAGDGVPIKCPLLVTNLPQVVVSASRIDVNTCRMTYVKDADGVYELSIRIHAFPDGISNEGADTAIHQVVVSLFVNNQLFAPVFSTNVTIEDNKMWKSPCIVRQFGDIYRFSETLSYVLADGEYLVYNDANAGTTEKVHMLFRKVQSNDQAPTSCAVFIQCGDDVVAIDKCGPKLQGQETYAGTVRLYQNGALTDGFSILRSNAGWQYNIIFPSLTKVHVDFTDHIAVTITTTAVTTGQITGLCNGLQATVANRISASSSIAYGVSKSTDRSPPGWRYSRCETDRDVSVSALSGLGCELTFAYDHTQDLEPEACGLVNASKRYDCGFSGITKRQCNEKGCCWDTSLPGVKWCFSSPAQPAMYYGSLAELKAMAPQLTLQPYEMDQNSHTGTPRWIGAVTEASAKMKCDSVLKMLFDLVTTIPSKTTFIEMCKYDINARDELAQGYSAAMELRHLTMNRLFSDYSSYIKQTNSIKINGGFLKSVEMDCPNVCSGTKDSSCVRSMCTCGSGTGGIACNLPDTRPVITEVNASRACDMAKRDCSKPFFSGMNFEGTNTLYRLYELGGGAAGINDTTDRNAVFRTSTSIGIVIAPSDKRTRFQVVVQANSKYSEPYTYIIYNSRCETFTPPDTVTPLPNICRIKSRCYSKNTVNPGNRREMCLPSVNATLWTPIAQVQTPPFTASLDGGMWAKGEAYYKNKLGISTTGGKVELTTDPEYPDYPVLTLGAPGKISSLNIQLNAQARTASSFSLILHVKPDVDPMHPYSPLLRFGSSSGPPGLSIYIHNVLTIVVSQPSMGSTRLTGTLTGGEWNVIGLVYNFLSTTFTLYVNGVQAGNSVSLGTIGPDIDHTHLTISDPITVFQGSVFGLRLFAEPLSLATLSLEAKANPSTYPAPPSPLPKVSFTPSGGYQVSLQPMAPGYMLVQWKVNGTAEGSQVKLTTSTTLVFPAAQQPTLGLSGKVTLTIQSCTASDDCNAPVESVLANTNSPMISLPSAGMFSGSLVVNGLEKLPLYKVQIVRGSSVDITLTLPIAPRGLCAPPCIVRVIGYRIPGVDSGRTCVGSSAKLPQVYVVSPDSSMQCGIDVPSTGQVTMKLYGAREPLISVGSETVMLAFAVSITKGASTIQSPFAVCEVTVNQQTPTRKQEVPVCSLLLGRYIFTFDKELLAVNSEGSYRMYKHGDIEEVQTHHRRCSATSQAVCTCGVSVRYKDTVFAMNRGCEHDNPANSPLLSQLYSTSSSADIRMKVLTRGTDLYSVLMPGGTRVDLKVEEDSISVSIYARKDIDSQNSPHALTGYCGNFDNIPGSVSSKLADNTVLAGDNQIRGCSTYSAASGTSNMCDCRAEEEPTGPGFSASCGLDDPLPCVKGTDVTAMFHFNTMPGRCFTVLPFKYSTTFVSTVNIGLGANAAVQLVIQQSQVYKAYLTTDITSKMSLTFLLRLASAEIALASATGGSLSAAGAAYIVLQLVQAEVEVHALTHTSLRLVDPISGLSKVPLGSSFCPKDCSNNGFCNAGTCMCGPGFSGSDCSIQLNGAPTVMLADEPQCCDGTTASCTSIPVVGSGFQNTPNLTCNVRLYTANGYSMQNIAARFVSARLVICPVPSVGYRHLTIAMSNDGRRFSSTRITIYLPGFTPPCLTCGPPGVHLQAQNCLIDGKCYKNFQKNAQNQHCYDRLAKTSWTTFNAPCSDLDKRDRIDCGWPGVSRTSCMVGNICCFSEDPGFPFCHFKAGIVTEQLERNPMCAQNPNTVACPSVGTTTSERLCHFMKCCYANDRCYKYTGPPPPNVDRPTECPATVDTTLTRTACGFADIDKNACHKKGCCFDPSSTQPDCYNVPPDPEAPEKCPATPDPNFNRTLCGTGSITQKDCYKLKCCYNPSTTKPNCYEVPPDVCAVKEADRRDCGFESITKNQCETASDVDGKKLCCFNGTSSSNPRCFFAVGKNVFTRPGRCPAVKVDFARTACGTEPINEEVCYAKGCCYDKHATRPDCYKIPNAGRHPSCPKVPELDYDRVACKNTSMDETSCHLAGCCYDESKSKPNCYKIPTGPPRGRPPVPEKPKHPSAMTGGPMKPVPPGPGEMPTGLITPLGELPDGTVKIVTWKVNGVVLAKRVFPSGSTVNITYFHFAQTNMAQNPEMRVCMRASYKGSTNVTAEVCSDAWRAVNAMVVDRNLAVREGEVVTVAYILRGYPGLLCTKGGSGIRLWVSLIGMNSPERSCGRSSKNIHQVAFSKNDKDCHQFHSVKETFINITAELMMTGLHDARVENNTNATINFRVGKEIKGNIDCIVSAGTFKVKVHDLTPANTQCVVGYPFSVHQFNDRSFSSNLAGVFVMYRHTKLPYEVHIMTKGVTPGTDGKGKSIAVVCAATVRVGRNVLMFSMCGSVKDKLGSTLVIKSQLKGPFLPGTKIFDQQGSKIVVMLPHGGAIFIDTGEVGASGFFNLFYSPGYADLSATSGLCGSFDGSSSTASVLNTIQGNNEANVLRVTHDQNIFLKGDSTAIKVKGWCNCQQSLRGVNCENTPYERCDNSMVAISVATLEANNVSTAIIRAWTDSNLQKPIGPVVPTFPAANSFTEHQARTSCFEAIYKTHIGSLCSTVIPAIYQAALDMCIDLIGRTGDTATTPLIIQNLKGACLRATSQFPTLPQRLHAIPRLVCINHCGGNGACNFGTCYCHSGYSGPACERRPNAGPEVTGTIGGNACTPSPDTLCDSVTLLGTFNPTLTYTCKVTYIDPLLREVLSVSTYPATMVLSGQLSCPLPSRKSALILIIDSDGRDSGKALPYLNINPDCLLCRVFDTGDYTCKQRERGCMILRKCWKPDTIYNDRDKCFYCNPLHNPSGWTRRDDLEECRDSPASQEYRRDFLLMVIITVILCLAFIFVCFCMCHRARTLANGVGYEDTSSEYSCDSTKPSLYHTPSTGSVYNGGNSTWGVYALRDQHWKYPK